MVTKYRWFLSLYLPTLKGLDWHIYTQTNVPVHLTLYYSDQPVIPHIRHKWQRGVATQLDPHLSLQPVIGIEQAEPGDTWTHSWILTERPFCTTLTFYFKGTFMGVMSPSVSPFFWVHYPEKPTIQTGHSFHIHPDQEVSIDQSQPDTNFLINTYCPAWSGRRLYNETNKASRILQHYTLPEIPQNATIEYADLWWDMCNYTHWGYARWVWAFKCLKDWNEAEATWNSRSLPFYWTTPGGDYTTEDPIGQKTSKPVLDDWLHWTPGYPFHGIKEIAQDAVLNQIPINLLMKFENELRAPTYTTTYIMQPRQSSARATLSIGYTTWE